MSNIEDWDVDAIGNSDPSPDGFPEGMFPSQVNDSNREVMAAMKRFYLQLTDPLNPSPIPAAFAAEAANALLLEGQNGAFFLNRVNHLNTQVPATISPQGAGSGLDADLLRGLTPEQISGSPNFVQAPSWMLYFGKTTTDLTVTTTINQSSGVRYYRNLDINGGTIRLSNQGQLIFFVNGTFTLRNGGSIDASGRGGNGGIKANTPNGDGQGGVQFIGGNGGSGWDGNDGLGGSTYWHPQTPNNQNGQNQNGSNAAWRRLIMFWDHNFLGGSGGGGSFSGEDSAGGNGGGIVIVIARNFDFRSGTQINCRGRENLQGLPDIDLQDAGVGGGGVIITAAVNTISNLGTRRIDAPVPAGFGNPDTNTGGNGYEVHYDLSPSVGIP